MVDRVLIVEDEPALLSLLERYLTRAGFAADGVSDAARALALTASQPDAHTLAVIDLTLPGPGGEELLSRLRAASPGLPAVLISGSPYTVTGTDGLTLFLQKPFLPQKLVDSIRSLLGTAYGTI